MAYTPCQFALNTWQYARPALPKRCTPLHAGCGLVGSGAEAKPADLLVDATPQEQLRSSVASIV